MFHVYSMFIVLRIAMSERALSAYFRFLVQLPPHVKPEDVIDVLLYFGFQDRLTRRKRQEAYHNRQQACSALFLSVPMATLCEVVTVVQEMAARDCEVRCLLHESHATQSIFCTNKTKSW